MKKSKMYKNKFALIILNWNNRLDTMDCINSLLNNHYQGEYKLFILDNGSIKDDFDFLYKRYKNNELVTLFKNDKNLGFAGGNNFILNKIINLDYDYFILVNNDTVLETNFLSKTNDSINKINDKQIGIIVPTIYYYDNKLTKKKIWRAGDTKKDYNEIKKIKRPCGCIYGISKKMIEGVGILDDTFFLYGEEDDYNYRGLKAGFNYYLIPNACAWHKVIENIDSNLKIYMSARNDYYLYNKYELFDKIIFYIYLSFIKTPYRFFKILFRRHNALKVFLKANQHGLKWIISKHKPKNPYIKE